MVKVKKIQWIPIGPNKLHLVGPDSLLKCKKKDNKIVSINVEDTFSINLGEVIKYNNKIPYKINTIYEMSNGYELLVAPKTKTSLFLMPMFGGDENLYLWKELFVNAFIGTEDYPDCIVFLYRFSGHKLFLKFEQALRKFVSFKDMLDPSPNYVLFVFDIPVRFKDDYNKFLLGQYSRFSPELKDNILKFHKTDAHSHIGQILYKNRKRRLRMQESLGIKISKNSELFDVPKLEEEIFNKDYYI